MRRVPLLKEALPPVLLLLFLPATGQEGASYKLTEHAFNAGGHPSAGTTPASANYRMSLDAVGDPAVGAASTGPSYLMDAGFSSAYPPPGEVSGLRFEDRDTLVWDAEGSAGRYNLYRGLLSNLPGGGYGSCEQQDLTDETATDTAAPPVAEGYSYLATAQNRLGEEGTLGQDSGDVERPNTNACP